MLITRLATFALVLTLGAASAQAAVRTAGVTRSWAAGTDNNFSYSLEPTDAPVTCTVTARGITRTVTLQPNGETYIELRARRTQRAKRTPVRLACSDGYKVAMTIRAPRAVKKASRVPIIIGAPYFIPREDFTSGPAVEPYSFERVLQTIAPRVRTYTTQRPVEVPQTGRMVIVGFWGGCSSCNADPGYERMQEWADRRPDVKVVAMSCWASWSEEWLKAHPTWQAPTGFEIWIRDQNAVPTEQKSHNYCISNVWGLGIPTSYRSATFFENGVRVWGSKPGYSSSEWYPPTWAADFPVTVYGNS